MRQYRGYNAARLPTLKQFDLRFTKDFGVGKYAFTGYLDARNILNLTEVVAVYAQTGTTSSAASRRPAGTRTTRRTFVDLRQRRRRVRQGDRQHRPAEDHRRLRQGRQRSNSFAPSATTTSVPSSASATATASTRWQNSARRPNRRTRRRTAHGRADPFVTGARTIRFGLEVNF